MTHQTRGGQNNYLLTAPRATAIEVGFVPTPSHFQEFAHTPDVVRDPGSHRRRDSQRLVNSAEIVIREVQTERVPQVFPLLAEAQCQPSHAAHLGSDRQVAAFDNRGKLSYGPGSKPEYERQTRAVFSFPECSLSAVHQPLTEIEIEVAANFKRLALWVDVVREFGIHPASQFEAGFRVPSNSHHRVDWIVSERRQEFGDFLRPAIRRTFDAPTRLVSVGHLLFSTLDDAGPTPQTPSERIHPKFVGRPWVALWATSIR